MSLTFLAKSRANSWKMSLVGQVLCQRMLVTPWARTMLGKPSAAAPPAAMAALSTLRREIFPVCEVVGAAILASC